MVDSRFRGNDGGGGATGAANGGWAGLDMGGLGHSGFTGVLDSGLRRNDGGATAVSAIGWRIPAFAGMTVGGGGVRYWRGIPAFAGMTVRGGVPPGGAAFGL